MCTVHTCTLNSEVMYDQFADYLILSLVHINGALYFR